MNSIETARIAFAGTPEFAVPCLEALIAGGAEVECVLTQPDRPAGRGRKLRPSPVKQFATRHAIPVLEPVRLDSAFAEHFPSRRPEVLVVVAFGLILPRWLLDWPLIGGVNVHASLLPRWRGAAPIQRAILAGDDETGVSIMRMTGGLDRGPVYAQRAIALGPAETSGELHDRLAVLGAELLVEVLPGILSGERVPLEQDESKASYAPKIDKRDAVLDFGREAVDLERAVRAYNPWPVAEARTADGRRLRIWRALALDSPGPDTPGTIVAAGPEGIDVAAGGGILRLIRVQPPGARQMSAAAYLAAHDLEGAAFVRPG